MLKNNTGIQSKAYPTNNTNVEIIGNTTYEVQSNYIGEIQFIDLLKIMIKRDVEKMNV